MTHDDAPTDDNIDDNDDGGGEKQQSAKRERVLEPYPRGRYLMYPYLGCQYD